MANGWAKTENEKLRAIDKIFKVNRTWDNGNFKGWRNGPRNFYDHANSQTLKTKLIPSHPGNTLYQEKPYRNVGDYRKEVILNHASLNNTSALDFAQNPFNLSYIRDEVEGNMQQVMTNDTYEGEYSSYIEAQHEFENNYCFYCEMLDTNSLKEYNQPYSQQDIYAAKDKLISSYDNYIKERGYYFHTIGEQETSLYSQTESDFYNSGVDRDTLNSLKRWEQNQEHYNKLSDNEKVKQDISKTYLMENPEIKDYLNKKNEINPYHQPEVESRQLGDWSKARVNNEDYKYKKVFKNSPFTVSNEIQTEANIKEGTSSQKVESGRTLKLSATPRLNVESPVTIKKKVAETATKEEPKEGLFDRFNKRAKSFFNKEEPKQERFEEQRMKDIGALKRRLSDPRFNDTPEEKARFGRLYEYAKGNGIEKLQKQGMSRDEALETMRRDVVLSRDKAEKAQGQGNDKRAGLYDRITDYGDESLLRAENKPIFDQIKAEREKTSTFTKLKEKVLGQEDPIKNLAKDLNRDIDRAQGKTNGVGQYLKDTPIGKKISGWWEDKQAQKESQAIAKIEAQDLKKLESRLINAKDPAREAYYGRMIGYMTEKNSNKERNPEEILKARGIAKQDLKIIQHKQQDPNITDERRAFYSRLEDSVQRSVDKNMQEGIRWELKNRQSFAEYEIQKTAQQQASVLASSTQKQEGKTLVMQQNHINQETHNHTNTNDGKFVAGAVVGAVAADALHKNNEQTNGTQTYQTETKNSSTTDEKKEDHNQEKSNLVGNKESAEESKKISDENLAEERNSQAEQESQRKSQEEARESETAKQDAEVQAKNEADKELSNGNADTNPNGTNPDSKLEEESTQKQEVNAEVKNEGYTAPTHEEVQNNIDQVRQDNGTPTPEQTNGIAEQKVEATSQEEVQLHTEKQETENLTQQEPQVDNSTQVATPEKVKSNIEEVRNQNGVEAPEQSNNTQETETYTAPTHEEVQNNIEQVRQDSGINTTGGNGTDTGSNQDNGLNPDIQQSATAQEETFQQSTETHNVESVAIEDNREINIQGEQPVNQVEVAEQQNIQQPVEQETQEASFEVKSPEEVRGNIDQIRAENEIVQPEQEGFNQQQEESNNSTQEVATPDEVKANIEEVRNQNGVEAPEQHNNTQEAETYTAPTHEEVQNNIDQVRQDSGTPTPEQTNGIEEQKVEATSQEEVQSQEDPNYKEPSLSDVSSRVNQVEQEQAQQQSMEQESQVQQQVSQQNQQQEEPVQEQSQQPNDRSEQDAAKEQEREQREQQKKANEAEAQQMREEAQRRAEAEAQQQAQQQERGRVLTIQPNS